MNEIMKLDQPIDMSNVERPLIMVDDEALDFMCANRFYKRSSLPNPFLHFEEGLLFLNYLAEVKSGKQLLPALVMMDINMPRMNGFEVVEKMREDDYFNDVPIVTMLTSSTDENDRKRAIDAGIHSYFIKPFDPSEYATFFASLTA